MDKMDIKSVNRAIILSIIFVIAFILAMVGLTYAFFGISISGNDAASSIIVDVVNLGTVTFTDGDQINATDIYPMTSEQRLTKNFTIKGASNETDTEYEIYLYVKLNQFVQEYPNEFTYTLNGASNAGGTTTTGINAELPSARVAPYVIGSGVLKANGDTHTYTFTIGLNETGSNQNYNRGKNFSARLVVSTKKYTNQRSIWGD